MFHDLGIVADIFNLYFKQNINISIHTNIARIIQFFKYQKKNEISDIKN